MAGRILDQSGASGISDLSNQTRIRIGIIAIIATTFIADIISPHDFAAVLILYYFAIFLCSRLSAPRAAFCIMAIVSALALFGIFLKFEDITDIGPANRMFIIATLWVMAFLAYHRVIKNREVVELRTTQESTNRFRDLFDNSGLGIQLANLDGRRLMVNKALADLLGYDSVAELMAMPPQSILAPHDRDRGMSTTKRIKAKGDVPSTFEIDAMRKDGSVIPLQVYWRTLEWQGEPAIQRTFVDLSERKRAQQALVDSEKQYRNLIERAPLGMQISDRDGNRLLANKALATLLGYDEESEVLALPNLAILARDSGYMPIPFEEIDKPGSSYPDSRELELLRKDGSTVSVQVWRRKLIWEGREAAVRTYIDLSERKRAQLALVDSERQYRNLIEQAVLGIQIADRDGKRLLVNNTMVSLLGYENSEEIIALPNLGFIAPHHHEKSMSFAEMLDTQDQMLKYRELDLLRKDGSVVPVQVFWRAVHWEGKRAVQLTYVDLSERKQAEAALHESERRYRDMIEGSTLGIHIADRNEHRLFVNLSLAKLLGYNSVAEVMRLNQFEMIAPHSRGKGRGLTDIEFTKETHLNSYEIDLLHKDGTHIPVEVFCRVLEWNGEKAIQRFIVDISERKRHESALRERDQTVHELRQALARTSQINTMAEISSVIAHELHQPLAAIANTASAAQRSLVEKTVERRVVLEEMLQLIVDQAGRAGSVIGGIRKLFGGGKTERSVEDLGVIIDEACILASNEIREVQIDITRQFENTSLAAHVDRVQIQQVIYNLLRNAIDAIRDVPEKNITVSIAKTEDGLAKISVQDNGPGLSPEIDATLFDPFVTTKENGMGMGLYTCQHIIESHGGRIWAESDEHGGRTTFEFTLPLDGEAEKSDSSDA
jgi:PAS domain S-box-containing protein